MGQLLTERPLLLSPLAHSSHRAAAPEPLFVRLLVFLVYFTFAVIPLAYFQWDTSPGLNLRKIGLLAMVPCFFLAWLLSPRRFLARRGLLPVSFWLLIGHFIVVAVLNYPYIPTEYTVMKTFATRPEGRSIVQTGIFLLDCLSLWIVAVVCCQPDRAVSMLRKYVAVMAALCVYGVVQFTGRYLGFSVNPLNTLRDEWPGFFLAGNLLPRMYSLGGEPREFGSNVVIALFLGYMALAYPFRLRSRFLSPAFLLFMLGCMVLSFSSAAYLTIALSAGVVLFFQLRVPEKRGASRQRGKRWVLFGLVVIGGSLAIRNMAMTLVTERVTQRLEQGTFEAQQGEIMVAAEYIRQNPEKLVLGAGLGNFYFYGREYVYVTILPNYYFRDSVLHLNNIWQDMLISGGVIGLALFVWFQASIVRRALRSIVKLAAAGWEEERNFLVVLASLCAVATIQMSFNRSWVLYILYGMLLGVTWSMEKKLERRRYVSGASSVAVRAV